MSPPQLDAKALTAKVKAEAHRLGFDLVGVTTPDPPPHLEVYEAWLAAGRHGTMAYLATPRARERRADPRRLLPECRSILVVGANYLPERPGAASPDSPLRVAAYALGEDYHEVLLERLKALVAYLEGEVGGPFPHRLYTDTGPILERELAQRAGLGWIGKNTCLINPQHGSYFLLAEALLGIELAPDEPFAADRCGTCTRCIEACPTACILPDRTLDASRCISYLTIELRGPIPQDLRSAIGDWGFGCDICQEVCPWNRRFARPTADPAFQPRPFLEQPHPRDFLELEPEAYQQALRRSPLKRAKRAGLARNAAVVAGNRQDLEDLAALIGALRGDPEPLVRAHAAWALGRYPQPEARQALEQALTGEADPQVRAEIEAALGRATGSASG